MPGVILVEIPFDQEAGFALNTVKADDSPGEDSNQNTFELDNPAFYQTAATQDEMDTEGIEVWVGSTVEGAEAQLMGTVTQEDGTTLTDSISLHSKPAQTVGAVLSQVIFRAKQPTQPTP